MKFYVYIDFSLDQSGIAVGFSTGRVELENKPAVGEYLKVGKVAEADAVEIKTSFLITGVALADKNVPGNEDLSWLLTCDDNFFSSRRQLERTVAYLEGYDFVFDEFEK